MGAICLVELLIEEIFILDLRLELAMNLLEDVVDGYTVGMKLLDVDVPGQPRVGDSQEGRTWLANELCEIDTIVGTVEVKEVDVFGYE